MRFVSRGDVRIAYEAADTAAPAMVFIHGWACDHSYFSPQFDHFASGRKVVALDLRGHGASDHPEPTADAYRVETLAKDTQAVAADAGLRRIVLVGHSLGALVALAYAAHGDDDVAAVVMIDPAPITNEAVKNYFRDSFAACAGDHDRSWRAAFENGLFMPTTERGARRSPRP